LGLRDAGRSEDNTESWFRIGEKEHPAMDQKAGNMNSLTHKTKIVATIGPASQSRETLSEMINAGMNVARLNFSHGDFENHRQVIENIRAASAQAGRRVAIMADLPGPKMRIGNFSAEKIVLRAGDLFTLTTDEVIGDQQRVSVTFSRLPQAVKPGNLLSLNDGFVQLEATSIRGNDVVCVVRVGGELRSRKGLNLPSIDLGIRAFTEHDRACLRFALKQGVDAVSQSFVENGADIRAVREAANEIGREPFIIAKIERARALDCIDEILDAADGVMIARGDLGVEVPIERIAVVQKDLMRRANQRAKPVITATQMLESMTSYRLPTRAEATDVSNAILDGTDCVMLSGESAMGQYPVEAVAMLGRIAAVVESSRRSISPKELYANVDLSGKVRPQHLIVTSVAASLEYLSPAAVFVNTRTGTTARRLASFHLPTWIVAVGDQEKTCQALLFSYGVCPVYEPNPVASWRSYVREWLKRHEISGEFALVTQGPSPNEEKASHRMDVIEL
jgi:pyruvate kinase